MPVNFNLDNIFWGATDVKHLTFNGNDVDALTINGNTVLLPLDYTATIPVGTLTNQKITFPVTKSKLARGLLIQCSVIKTSSTGRASFGLSYNDGTANYVQTIAEINLTTDSSKVLNLNYNGSTCTSGGGPILSHWGTASKGATYLSLIIGGASNLYLNGPMTIRVVSDWESREEEDTSTTTTTKTTEATATAAADDYGFTLIDE